MTLPALEAVDADLAARLRGVRLLVLDFDGVLTDNAVYVFEDGREAVRCWRSDGIGLTLLREAGVEAVVLSKEQNPVVQARCRKLGLACQQGIDEKGPALEALMRARGLEAEQVAYVGNDVNDLPCLRRVGLPIVVQDAHPDVLEYARLRTRNPGGRGAVREVCDLLVRARAGA